MTTSLEFLPDVRAGFLSAHANCDGFYIIRVSLLIDYMALCEVLPTAALSLFIAPPPLWCYFDPILL